MNAEFQLDGATWTLNFDGLKEVDTSVILTDAKAGHGDLPLTLTPRFFSGIIQNTPGLRPFPAFSCLLKFSFSPKKR